MLISIYIRINLPVLFLFFRWQNPINNEFMAETIDGTFFLTIQEKTRENEILFRRNEILSCTNEISSRINEILSH